MTYTLSDFTLFQKHLLLKFWCFTTLPKSPSKKGLNPKLNRQVHHTSDFTQGFPMWQSYNPLKITGKEPGQDSCYSSHPQFPLNPLLLMKDSNDLHIYNSFRSHLPSSLPTITCTEQMLVCVTLLAEPMGTRFLIPSSPESPPRSPTLMGADSLWIDLKFLRHANHLSWELLTQRIGACNDSSSLYTFVRLYACVKKRLSSLASLILFGPHKACHCSWSVQGLSHKQVCYRKPSKLFLFAATANRQTQELLPLEDSSRPCWALLYYLTV